MNPRGWSEVRLGDLIQEHGEKSRIQDQHLVMTSSRTGLILQSDYYSGGRIGGRRNVGFHIVPMGYITYRSRSDDSHFFFNKNQNKYIGIVSHFYPVFKFRDDNEDFFLDLLNYHRSKIGALAVGSSQKVLSLNALREVTFVLPPPEERTRIGQVFQTWDRGIETVEALIAIASKQKAALMQSLLPQDGPLPKKRLSGFSGEWRSACLGDVADISKGEQKGRAGLARAGPVPVINGGTSPSGYTDVANTPAGTITISEGGNSCGYIDLIERPFWCGGHCYALENLKVDRDYLFAVLKHRQSQVMALRVGSGLPNIQKNALVPFAIPVPSMPEQVRIGEISALADAEIGAYQAQLNALRREKIALLQQLLTGKRRVKYLDEAV